jgi:hypothetical protein
MALPLWRLGARKLVLFEEYDIRTAALAGGIRPRTYQEMYET